MDHRNTGNRIIDSMLEKARRGAFVARKVQGEVIGCDTKIDGMETIHAVHIRNGSLTESFWVASELKPVIGEWVKGTINTFDDTVMFADLRLKPIFDLENQTRNSEQEAFDWFRQYGDNIPWLRKTP